MVFLLQISIDISPEKLIEIIRLRITKMDERMDVVLDKADLLSNNEQEVLEISDDLCLSPNMRKRKSVNKLITNLDKGESSTRKRRAITRTPQTDVAGKKEVVTSFYIQIVLYVLASEAYLWCK
ncbi:uncharacterized protein [Spinacia oleracea]|uniref:Uncharacterized protein n=1 Tax=Spinacia oleracea TaxID=3562 RepID=A0ABM3QJG7_SPIOL|nr:uncharacterized protein LOC130459902 [Spinacia oleracea]